MKVTVTYDFSTETIEDVSKDKVEINLSFKEYKDLANALFHCATKLIGTEQGREAWNIYEKIRNYDTKCIG